MLKVVGLAAVTAVVMDTLLLRILMPQHTRTARCISLFMHSHRTATAAESGLGLGTITTAVTADTMAVTAGTTEVIVGIMVDTIVETMVATTVAISVDITDITESIEITGFCGLVRLGKLDLPSLPDKLLKPVPLS